MNIETMQPVSTAHPRAAQDASHKLRLSARGGLAAHWSALIIILSLTAAVVSFSLVVKSEPNEPFYAFHISQSVRGLVALIFIFTAYMLYQQLVLHRLSRQLLQQIEIASTQERRAEEFFELAMLDPLTGLHNRRFAEERLTAEIVRSERHGTPLTVCLLDLNGFKLVNDNHGHAAGDTLLREFAGILCRAIRGSDLVVRLGGDEFMVLLPDCKLGEEQLVLDRLRPRAIQVDGMTIPFTFSAGWTNYQPGESPVELIKRADSALYMNKRSQSNIPAGVR